MQVAQSSPYSFTAIDAGVDWLTCTARGRDARKPFLAQANAILQTDSAGGVEITAGRIRDYSGWKSPGLFVGSRRDDDLVILTSDRAAALWSTIAPLATNVSRLDLQVTVWTHGEQPVLSRWEYQRLKRANKGRGRPRELDLRQKHPHGDTLYVNNRRSDNYGRLYDYASAHKQGEPRTIWRYEAELKRLVALAHCRTLLDADDPRLATESIVAHWFTSRGVQKTWSSAEFPHSEGKAASIKQRDILAWFDTSLSKTVGRAIRHHGLTAVLDALHLSDYVIPCRRKVGKSYANITAPALCLDDRRGAARTIDRDPVLD